VKTDSYKLFIDDERFPITDDWVIVRTSEEEIIQGNLTIPGGFRYSVHSQNPIGVANIKGLMDNIIKAFIVGSEK
jgi:hypothetical protein